MTTQVTYNEKDLSADHPRRKLRDMSREEFVENWGSGTLRKSSRLGFDVDEAYLKERVRFEFGTGFELIQRSRMVYSDIKLESSQALTELGWHAERMIELRPFESDKFVCKRMSVEYPNGSVKEGCGILVSETSCPWLPKGYMVFALVAPMEGERYGKAINPF